MSSMKTLVVCVVAMLLQAALAFVPTCTTGGNMNMLRPASASPVSPSHQHQLRQLRSLHVSALRMAEKDGAPEIRDEDKPPPQKISNEMKARLKEELVSQGADPNRSTGNPILWVSAVIGILVIAGGKGIFY